MGNSSSSSTSRGKRGRSRSHRDDGSSYGGRSSSSDKRASGPPSAPGKPYLVVPSPADEPDVVTVKWKQPVHDGGSKVSGYIVEHRRTTSPHWVRATPGKVQHNELTLSGLEPGWRYQFRIKAVNSSGYSLPSAVSDTVTITAHRTAVVAPVFARGIEDHVALENDQVKFEVELEGTPAPKISWYKDGFELFSNRRQRVNTDNGISALYIHQAEYSDEGEIKCSATNRAGYAITKARLRLEAPPMVRLSQDYEEGLLLEQNEPMRLKVSVSGRPLPQVTWFHDGEEIRGGDRFEVIHTDKYAALKLACVKRLDRGCYQIQAVNPLGEHTASFLVTVTDKPSPPGKVHVSKTSGKSVTLSWKPPEDDGGCKIGNYIIEYNRVGWDMWLKASTSRKLMADLDDLLEGSEYRFRVKAENPYGISLPSEVSDPVFLPDIRRGIYKPVNAVSLLSEDEEKLVKIQETKILGYFGRKSKSPEQSAKFRKLSVDEVSPPVPKRRKKKTKKNENDLETNIYKSLSFLDVLDETWQQPIEQKDHWGLSPGLKVNDIINPEDSSNEQNITLLDQKTKGNSTHSLLLNFERGSAPPISLSSPELGNESDEFEENYRNSYSSSELLYERNLNRFNGYSNEETSSSEAQKIAIYAMDRKNSLRRSPITRRSNDGSEDKSIFGDSDSIQSVIEVNKKISSNNFLSSTTSLDEKMDDGFGKTVEDLDDVASFASFTDLESRISRVSDEHEREHGSENFDDEFELMKFGSGKRALEHDSSSAFFSTVYCDDDYLSDQRLSDGERSASSVGQRSASPVGQRSASPVGRSKKDDVDALSQDSLNSGSAGSDEFPQNVDADCDTSENSDGKKTSAENRSPCQNSKTDSAEISRVDEYLARDGIPKYVMLPNPFYKDSAPQVDRSDRVKFELSTDSDGGIVPPEIPKRAAEHSAADSHLAIPVITVTEMSENSPVSLLRKIFVPPFAGQNDAYYSRYNNVNSSAFNTLKRFANADAAGRGNAVNRTRSPSPEVVARRQRPDDVSGMTVVKHYGDIAEAYGGAGKKPAPKTYLDFEQLKMAAVDDEPTAGDDRFAAEVESKDEELRKREEEEYDDDDAYPTDFEDESSRPEDRDGATTTDDRLRSAVEAPPADAIPYLMVFGNLSLALFGYWLYACKDERASVPIFGFLLFRFFKTQIWDRIG